MNATANQFVAGCLSDDDLQAFKTGLIDDPATEARMATHLGNCDSCESRLDSISSQADLVVALLRAADPFETFSVDSANASIDSTKPPIPIDVKARSGVANVLPSAPVESLPERIDKYFVLDWIARGGFGNVYKAKDPDTNRIVAIKVPRVHSEASAAQFLKEARLAAQLQHPSIVQVYDYGRQADGSCFVVMQYIEGHSLRAVLKGSANHECNTELIADIAAALHFAHAQGIYHRDVKPENILLDQSGKPYLTDFGLAIREDERWNYVDEIAGTFSYMSPEQVRGEPQFIDGRTDIWSLGVVLYEVLTRQKPFAAKTTRELIRDIEHREPRALSTIDESISPKLDQICRKCLEKDAARRYATAAELAKDLRPRRVSRSGLVAIVTLLIVATSLGVALARSWTRDPASQWQPFMDRKPIPIVRNLSNPYNFWTPDPKENRFAVQSGADVCIASYGSCQASKIEMQTTLSIDGWIGTAGLFWGLHDSRPTHPETEMRCYALCVARSDEIVPMIIELSEFELEAVSGLGFRVRSITRKAMAAIEVPSDPFIVVQLESTPTGIKQVLIDNRPISFDRVPEIEWPGTQQTQYGVTSVGSSTVFQDSFLKIQERE